MKAGKTEEAITLYSEAIDLDPDQISVNILAIIEKNATEAKICNSTNVVLPSPSPTIYYEFTEEQLRENYVMVTLGLTTLQQVAYFLNIYIYI